MRMAGAEAVSERRRGFSWVPATIAAHLIPRSLRRTGQRELLLEGAKCRLSAGQPPATLTLQQSHPKPLSRVLVSLSYFLCLSGVLA